MLSGKINEYVGKLESKLYHNVGKNYDSSVIIFKNLSNLILKLSGSAKSVANKGKNQIVDPLKLFSDNYNNLNKQFLSNLK